MHGKIMQEEIMLKIIKDSENILHEKCVPVELPIDNESKKLLLDMVEYIRLSQSKDCSEITRAGVGLAAPQVGCNKRMFAVYLDDEDGKHHEYALVNPRITQTSIQKCYLSGGEGCLSVDEDHDGNVERYYRVVIKAFDVLQNKDIELKAQGYLAIVLQHEYDHLEGLLYYDRISSIDPYRVSDDSIEI